MQEKLWISAGLIVKQGKSPQQVAEALHNLAKLTMSEPGCIQFDVLQHKESPEKFTLWECWHSEEALKTHFDCEHTLAYLAQELTDITYIEKLVLVE